MPSPRVARPTPYRLGKEKVWFTRSAYVCRSYLFALLTASALLERGILEVPHGSPPAVYDLLLQGKQPPRSAAPLQTLCNHIEGISGQPQGRREPRSDVKRQSHSDGEASRRHRVGDGHGDNDGRSSSPPAILAIAEDPAATQPANDDGGPQDSGTEVPHKRRRAEDAVVAAAEPPTHVEAAVVAAAEPPACARGDRGGWSFLWGACRITFSPPAPQHKHGLWQGACCFHRKSEATGCKKAISLRGSTEADSGVALRAIVFWLSILAAARPLGISSVERRPADLVSVGRVGGEGLPCSG